MLDYFRGLTTSIVLLLTHQINYLPVLTHGYAQSLGSETVPNIQTYVDVFVQSLTNDANKKRIAETQFVNAKSFKALTPPSPLMFPNAVQPPSSTNGFSLNNVMIPQPPVTIFFLHDASIYILPNNIPCSDPRPPSSRFNDDLSGYENVEMLYKRHSNAMKAIDSPKFVWLLSENNSCASDACLNCSYQLLNISDANMVIVLAQEDKLAVGNQLHHSMLNTDRIHLKFVLYLSDEGVKFKLNECMRRSYDHELQNSASGYPTRLNCTITVTVTNKDENRHASKTSVLFVSISFILLLILSLAWLVFYYIQRFRYIHTKKQISRRLASLAKKAVARIPVKTLKCGDKELNMELYQCAVCIESFYVGDVVRLMPCKHVYHRCCIDPWLLEMRSCPMCKLDILRAYGMQMSCSEDELDGGLLLDSIPMSVGAPNDFIDDAGGSQEVDSTVSTYWIVAPGQVNLMYGKSRGDELSRARALAQRTLSRRSLCIKMDDSRFKYHSQWSSCPQILADVS